MKKFLRMMFTVSAFALLGCGDDSSSGIFSMESSFEIVFDKAKYSYNKKDSTFKVMSPVCKTGTLGNLVGPNDNGAEWDTVSYKAYINKGVISLKKGDKVSKFTMEETTFPVGFWANPETDDQTIQGGYRLDKKQLMKTVTRYDGNCFMENYFSLFRKGNPALESVDESLTDFYRRFLPKDGKFDEKEMISDIRAPYCDKLTLFDGLVSLKVSDFRESSGKITVAFEKNKCPLTFQIRYAMDPKDCAAAFDDFENDRHSAEKFKFEDYSNDIVYDDYCIEQLILDLKKAKKIPLKAEAAALADEKNAFVQGAVNMILKGLK